MKFTLVATLMAAAVSAAPAFNVVHPRKTHATKSSSGSVPAATGSGSSSGNSSSGGSTSGTVTEACNIGYATQNGGTTGGAAGEQTTVTSLEELKTAASADGAAIIIIDGAIEGSDKVDVASDKTIIGAAGSSLTGVGLRVKKASNVIIRNVKISKVLADNGDAVTVQASNNVWLDHLDLSSDRDHDKDYYDGLLDVTHGSDYITISNTYLHDHWKASLVGHSDSNSDEDTGHLIVTYANNWFSNINSRGPSFRFGTGHVYNHYAENSSTGINTRMGAQMLIESAVFSGIEKAIESADSETVGYAVVNDVDLGEGTNTVEAGTLKTVPYEYELLGSANVKASVTSTAGQTLSF
ncbi:pectate lyase a [Diaporthe amygdali]|uniref:pectate lyase a n=1 Tax=Phomopsis amygdali TaxID=1214568 RepID=UPI0022FEFAC9|nr:pectate lyase a [Diaporthe amygdali]KAJ0119743.1 pectate lyase a [Diaporthe amygdali]